MEKADGVGAAADAGHERVGQTAFRGDHLFLRFLADNRLEVAHHGGIGMRTRGRAD